MNEVGIFKMDRLSNHELARRYNLKQNIIGKILDYRLLSNDRVELVEVINKEDRGRLEIPSFITDIALKNIGTFGDDYIGPLNFCSYTDIYVDNILDIKYNMNYLCSGMVSDRLRLEFRYPERVYNMAYLFKNCDKLIELDISKLDTRNVVTMESMFEWCISLGCIDLNRLDTSNVADMAYIFSGCISLKDVKLDKLDTRNVVNMEGMFERCMMIESIDISNLNTSNVRNMNYIFMNCLRLKNINISGIDTSKVTTMEQMFNSCESLEYINVSKLDTHNVESMRGMFKKCKNLKSIDIRNFNMRKVNDMSGMFLYSCDISKIKGHEMLSVEAYDRMG